MRAVKAMAYLFAVVLVFAFGITGTYLLGHNRNNFNVQINSLTDAAYFTVVTVSTVGYGDIFPVTNIAKLFVMTLIVSGLGVFLSAVTVLSSELVDTRIEQLSGKIGGLERRFLRNHVILIGTDTVNMLLAEKLKIRGANFVIVTADKVISDRLRNIGYKAYLADETNEEELKKFEFHRAKSIILDMHDKSRMIYAILIVRNLAKNARIVVVAHNKEEERNIRGLGAGIGVINPADLASGILSKRIFELE